MILRRWVISILFAAGIVCTPVTASAGTLGTIGGIWALLNIGGAIADHFETCPPVQNIDQPRGVKDFQLAERYSKRVGRDYALAYGPDSGYSSSILMSDLTVSNRCAMRAAKSWPLIVEQKNYRNLLERNSALRSKIPEMISKIRYARGERVIERVGRRGWLFWFDGVMATMGLVALLSPLYFWVRRWVRRAKGGTGNGNV